MNPTLVCILVFLLMMAMILIGIPLSISMLSCALLGFTIVSGFDLAVTQFTNSLFTLSHSYNFAVIPAVYGGGYAGISLRHGGRYVHRRQKVAGPSARRPAALRGAGQHDFRRLFRHVQRRQYRVQQDRPARAAQVRL